MTPQGNFTVLAAIDPARAGELSQLLISMNDGPGRLNLNNPLIPFAQFDTLHYGRFLILNDNCLLDTRAYGGGPVPIYPLYLAFLGDIDGDVDTFFAVIAQRAGPGLRTIFSCCIGFADTTDLVGWMKDHTVPAIAVYVNTRGRTVLQIREEAVLQEALRRYLSDNVATLGRLRAQDVHRCLRDFVEKEKAEGRLKLSEEKATPLGWWIGNALHLVAFPVLSLLFLPIFILAAPFYVIGLRRREKSDPELCW